MTIHRPPWSQLLETANRATRLTELAGLLVDHLDALDARPAAVWTRRPRGPWDVVAALGEVPAEPPADGTGWHVQTIPTAHRVTAMGWRGEVEEDTAISLAAVLETTLRRMEAQDATTAVTHTAEQRLASILDASPDAVLVVDAEGRIVR
ncbi:MAG: hypothetical protein JXA83_07340, partial [Acidimicrobiales bacterium]|nr:hypothetical protein [Acidimicrobiales bacterium]